MAGRIQRYEFRGTYLTMRQIASLVGLSQTTIARRIALGWRGEELAEPPGERERAKPGEGVVIRSIRPKTVFEARVQVEKAQASLALARNQLTNAIQSNDRKSIIRNRERNCLRAEVRLAHWKGQLDLAMLRHRESAGPKLDLRKTSRRSASAEVVYCENGLRKAKARLDAKQASYAEACATGAARGLINAIDREVAKEATSLTKWLDRLARAREAETRDITRMKMETNQNDQ